MKLISLYGNTSQCAALPALRTFIALLLERGVAVEVESEFHAWLMEQGIVSELCPSTTHPSAEASLIVSAGGDGTLIKAARWAGFSEIPVAGINTGHLGFLTSWQLADAPALVEAIATPGGFEVEARVLLRLSCEALPPDIWPYALNEVSLLKENSGSMITVRTDLDDAYLTDYTADGLLIADRKSVV